MIAWRAAKRPHMQIKPNSIHQLDCKSSTSIRYPTIRMPLLKLIHQIESNIPGHRPEVERFTIERENDIPRLEFFLEQIDQSRVIVLPVVRRGVTPAAPIAIFGVTVPDHKIGDAPPPDLPVLKCVMVVPAAPLAAKSILATGDTLPAEDVVHPVERNTFTRT
jgi:hypothetical protein